MFQRRMQVKRNLANANAIAMLLFFVILIGSGGFGSASVAVAVATASNATASVKIHYIDVGQADSILIQSGASNMLIDAGNRNDDAVVIAYLKKFGVKKLDYVIGTHPHEDHIGGLAAVINEFTVSKIIMPKVTTNTKTFENLLTTIKNKGLKITTPVANSSIKLGSAGANFRILAPINNSYEDLNNYSIVLKMAFGKTSFLFQGDAENLVEQEILKAGYDVKADVIKLGHHGSNSSSSSAYLSRVAPKYAIISCGKDNDYGHPHSQVLKRLADKKINYFRTDKNGTIVCTTDGKMIKFSLAGGTVQSARAQQQQVTKTPTTATATATTATTTTTTTTQQNAIAVYVTKTGEKYHRESCSSLRNTKIKITLQDAKAKGYLPCSICNPPN